MNYGQRELYSCIAAETIGQYFAVSIDGLVCNAGNTFYGINQDKPILGDHMGVAVSGETKAHCRRGAFRWRSRLRCHLRVSCGGRG